MAIEQARQGRHSILLDMEWNQPLPWKNYPHVPKALMPGEIIQIGAVKLDAQMRRIAEVKISVRPKYFKQVHWKVKKLTHISEEEMRSGLSFPEAAKQLGDFLRGHGSGDYDIFAWGGEDERILIANLETWGLNPGWLPDNIYDLRLIYDGLCGRTENSTSLTDAAQALGAELELEQHDSLNDARYAAVVCAGIDLELGMARYEEWGGAPAPGQAQQRILCKGLAPLPEGLKEPKLQNFTCPVCGQSLRCRNWVPQNKDRQIGLVRCSEGHESFLRVRFSHRPDGTSSALRSVYVADEEAAAFYQKKYHRQQEALKRIKRAQEKARRESEAAERGEG